VTGFGDLRALCHEAVAAGVTPGLVVVVGSAGKVVLHEAFGLRQIDPSPLPTTTDTVYDLASLTKPLVTGLLVMQAVAAGRLRLKDPCPGRAGEAGATVRLALAHASGLPAHHYFPRLLGIDLTGAPPAPALRSLTIDRAASEPIAYPPGSRSLYSDLDFMLLGDLVERIEGRRLDVLAAERICRPLGLRAFGYLAVGAASPTAFGGLPVAPTVRCPVRGRLIVGEVDDLNAYGMGGVAGHAGLFGTAGDVATVAHALCAAWRDVGQAGGRPLVPAEVLRTFWTTASIPGSSWRLGWDGPAPTGSIAGEIIARDAVGHVAFTGCSLWIEPERERFVLVLSNRTHPAVPADNTPFRQLRPALNDAALAAL
jgi:serine-type D-Ala-D-Ala carboxypeptidase